eukprot:CAMPEP_0170355222 /NCGR_PEP_ID=MMETSP0117_2-20130122/530_1 /TAXON_ID=400756 /ORGANISM="Durinskia baltica, Strain CSIRO CS-38" /LENGTH=184 /DNA_ID=CAMNT_0010609251 /DNA_START=138 /DNA_END=691 /DNA_ORIENTATION=+
MTWMRLVDMVGPFGNTGPSDVAAAQQTERKRKSPGYPAGTVATTTTASISGSRCCSSKGHPQGSSTKPSSHRLRDGDMVVNVAEESRPTHLMLVSCEVERKPVSSSSRRPKIHCSSRSAPMEALGRVAGVAVADLRQQAAGTRQRGLIIAVVAIAAFGSDAAARPGGHACQGHSCEPVAREDSL